MRQTPRSKAKAVPRVKRAHGGPLSPGRALGRSSGLVASLWTLLMLWYVESVEALLHTGTTRGLTLLWVFLTSLSCLVITSGMIVWTCVRIATARSTSSTSRSLKPGEISQPRAQKPLGSS